LEQSYSFRVERHQAFGVKLSQRNVQCPLFGPDVAQTIKGQVDTLSNADPGEASQQEGIGIKVVCPVQFLLESLIIFRRQRPGEILGANRKISLDNETGVEGMPLEGQINQQAPKTEQMLFAGGVSQGRILIAEPTEPTQHMGIATELRQSADLRKSATKISEDAGEDVPLISHRRKLQGQR
jgi:hypothetical protein